MTKAAELPLHREEGNGLTTLFMINFDLFALNDLVVELRDEDDLPVTIVNGGTAIHDYVVNYVFDNSTQRYTNVAIAFITAPPTGYTVGWTRRGVQDQSLNLTASGALPAESIEQRFDRVVSMIQDLQAQLDRAVKTPVGSDDFVDVGTRHLRGIADPVDITDAVTKGFLTAGSLSINQIDGVTVASIAALKALPVGGTNPATCVVTGYFAQGDGGGGFYYYDANSAAFDDGVTYITPGSGVGRWRLNPNGWISERQRGNMTSGQTVLEATNVAGAVLPMIVVDPDAGVYIEYDGLGVKLETQADGAKVTGIARATAAAVDVGDLLRKGEFDTAQATQDFNTANGLAGKAALIHTHNYSLVSRFASANQAVATSGASSHGLGAQPTPGHYGVSLVCITTDLGYAVGDRVNLLATNHSSGGQFYAPSVWASTTQVGWAMPTTTPFIVQKGSTVPAAITAARWQLVAWAELVS